MADITMCTGIGCPISHKCYRKNAKTDYKFQSIFANPPYDKENRTCKDFWECNDRMGVKNENR